MAKRKTKSPPPSPNRSNRRDGRSNGRLDDIDVAILKQLQSDSKITNAELAKRVGITPPSMLERVRKLEQRGVIRGYVALLCAEAVNKKTTALVFVRLRSHGRDPLNRVKRRIAAFEEVQSLWHTAGEQDFVLKVAVADIAGYEDFATNKLSTIKEIGWIRTAFVLDTCKDQMRYPLDAV